MKKVVLSILLLCAFQMAFSQTQGQMNAQALSDYNRADADMARMYKLVMSRLPSQAKKTLLLEAQRAWIKYKESHCKAYANLFEGGSMYPLIYYSCLEELTIDRKKKLQAYLDNL